MYCKYKNRVHRHILYVAKTYIICRKANIICCEDKIYMLQRQNIYIYMLYRENMYVMKIKICVIKTNLYVIQTKFVCYKDKMYML